MTYKMDIKLPIICHSKKALPKLTKFKKYNCWICPEPEDFFLDSDHDEEYSDDPETDNRIFKDSNDNRIGGLIRKTTRISETMYILNSGWVMRTYAYPNVKIPFKSPMVRWWNLFYCGGFSISGPNDEHYSWNENIIDAVINKEKPMGFAFYQVDKMNDAINKLNKNCLKRFEIRITQLNNYIGIFGFAGFFYILWFVWQRFYNKIHSRNIR